jgi:hypothetical protein
MKKLLDFDPKMFLFFPSILFQVIDFIAIELLSSVFTVPSQPRLHYCLSTASSVNLSSFSLKMQLSTIDRTCRAFGSDFISKKISL